MPGHLAAGQRVADIVRRPMLARGRNGPGTLRQAARGQRDVGCDADVSLPYALGNPIVRRVRALAHDDHAHIGPARRQNRPRAVGDDEDLEAQAIGHAIDLLAHRAGIAIDIDIAHASALVARLADDRAWPIAHGDRPGYHRLLEVGGKFRESDEPLDGGECRASAVSGSTWESIWRARHRRRAAQDVEE